MKGKLMPTKQDVTCYNCEKDFTAWKKDIQDSGDYPKCPSCREEFNVWLRMLWGEQN